MPSPRPPARATQAQIEADTARLEERHQAYLTTFGGPPGNYVLEDLAKFCRAHETCFDADPRLHALAEGRREVWLRIQQALRLDGDELFRLYAPPTIMIVKEQSNG